MARQPGAVVEQSDAAGELESQPIVSVVVPVYNVESWLRQCLDSVVEQSIGFDRLELIAVDDGSTDASSTILDEYAARYPNVVAIHQPNSGGPGGPRNVGVDRATGTYVFFLDADDYLGPEALERMVAMAERNASDIVLGKLVGIEGRRRYSTSGVFRRSLDRAELEVVYPSGNVLKLFRRALLDRLGLRFREGIPGGEDGDFMARIYPEAGTISVVADYDCYFARRREGSQTRRRDRGDTLADRLERLEAQRIKVLASQRKAGPGRDRLMRRHVKKVARLFGSRWRSLGHADRRHVFEVGAGLIGRWHTDGIQRSLPAYAAIRAWCLQRGLFAELEDIVATPVDIAFRDPIVEDGRLYARYPHFRDGSGIPDSCFDITREVVPRQTLARAELLGRSLLLSGEAYLTLVGGETAVELRRWPRGPRWRFGTTVVDTPDLRDLSASYPAAGYAAGIDLATAAGGRPLPRGTWSIHLSVGTASVRRDTPVQLPRRASRAAGAALVAGGGLRRTAAGQLRLRIGRPNPLESALERAEAIAIRLRRGVGRLLRTSPAGRLARRAKARAAGTLGGGSSASPGG